MLYSEVQEIIKRVNWLGGTVNLCHPESMPQSVILIDWGIPLRKISKTGYMPDILVEASNEFFKRVEEEVKEEKAHAVSETAVSA